MSVDSRIQKLTKKKFHRLRGYEKSQYESKLAAKEFKDDRLSDAAILHRNTSST